MAILASEFPLVFVLITVIVVVSGIWFLRYNLLCLIVGSLSILLFLSPVLRAGLAAAKIQSMFKSENTYPFNLLSMITGSGTAPVMPQYFTYNKKEKLTLSFNKAESKKLQPCVIAIHGGAWHGGNNDELPELNELLAEDGYHVASINYRLAPAFRFPAAIEDVECAIRYLKLHATELKIDTNRFVLMGRSAGAQIALLTAYTTKQAGIKGVIDFYGPADMVWGYSAPANPWVLNSRKIMEDYLGGTFKQIPNVYNRSSPLFYASKKSVPTLIIHGKNDVLVSYEHSIRLHEKLNRLGVKNFFVSLPWATHGFDYNINGPGGQLSTFAVKRFLEIVCK